MEYKYSVAGHVFAVSIPECCTKEDVLMPYESFLCEESDAEPLFRLKLDFIDDLRSLNVGQVKECLNDEPPYFWIFDNEGTFSFAFSYSKSRPDCILKTSQDFRDNVVHVPAGASDSVVGFALSNAMMLLYTFCTSPYDTLMVHASVPVYEDGAYMFLGRSGTGKSTHSRLWFENIEGAWLLNDDNPVIRVIGQEVIIYGTPWSGKTPCYINRSFPLKAVVRLSQAPHNSIKPLSMLHSYASLMPACSCMRWDRRSADFLHKTVEKVIKVVPGFALECLPDADAALTCFNAVCGK